ncbi:MAG: NUDIX hydrolase [Candidatus Thorarchaeota archaeon]
MIDFEKNNIHFVFRVAGIALHDGMILLHRSAFDDFWALPGGRCELLENSKDTLEREMKEELEIEIIVNRLLFVVENFFKYKKVPYHELGIYYLMKIPKSHWPNNQNLSFTGREGKIKLIFKWFKIEKLPEIEVYPTFLKLKIKDIKNYPEHIIHQDN